jgi:hypothetical protein
MDCNGFLRYLIHYFHASNSGKTGQQILGNAGHDKASKLAKPAFVVGKDVCRGADTFSQRGPARFHLLANVEAGSASTNFWRAEFDAI